MGTTIPYIMENMKCLKPPTSIHLVHLVVPGPWPGIWARKVDAQKLPAIRRTPRGSPQLLLLRPRPHRDATVVVEVERGGGTIRVEDLAANMGAKYHVDPCGYNRINNGKTLGTTTDAKMDKQKLFDIIKCK